MNKKRTIYVVLFTLFLFLVFVKLSYSYDTKVAHPFLAEKSIELFNKSKLRKISPQESTWIKKGAVEEDTPGRWLNHFYNIDKGKGLWFNDSAKEWATDTEAQSSFKYKFLKGNQTLQKAIDLYSKGKDKEAFIALGHTLHLIADMTVPAHTRIDVHIKEDPYEGWVKRNGKSAKIKINDIQKFSSIQEYFDYLASYSSKYFLSKDTVDEEKLAGKGVFRLSSGKADIQCVVGRTFVDTEKFCLVKYDETLFGEPIYTFNDLFVHSSYFSLLAPKAISAGAGVIDLFIKEAEAAKEAYESKSVFKKLGGSFSFNSSVLPSANVVNIVGSTPMLSKEVEEIDKDRSLDAKISSVSTEQSPSSQTKTPPQLKKVLPKTLNIEAKPTPPKNPTPKPKKTQLKGLTFKLIKPTGVGLPAGVVFAPMGGFGGGAPVKEKPKLLASNNKEESKIEVILGCTNETASNYNSEATEDDSSCIYPDITPPDAPLITSPLDFSQTFTTNEISFTGTAEASSTISTNLNSATTTVNQGGWNLPLSLNQGTTTISFYATDEAGNTSSSTEATVFIDSQGPEVELNILECEDSLVDIGCLLATTTLSINWNSTSNDLEYFETTFNGTVSTTTATSTTITVEDNSTNTFSVKAKDKTGNWSNIITQTVETSTSPVVINEISWAGTRASASDEWIELVNKTDKEINLNNWTLYSQTDMKPYIPLSGTISANGYYLIERTDDNTVSDVQADLTTSFGSGAGMGLSNIGEALILDYASTTIDQTPTTSNGKWLGGTTGRRTMERISPFSQDWGTNNQLVFNGLDAEGDRIRGGTPRKRNSLNYLISKGIQNISQDITLTKANSPYLVDSRIQEFTGTSTLTIEPGVVIKFYNSRAGLSFKDTSKIIAQGTEKDPIIFTSYYDDRYGGDLNNDGICDPNNASSTASCPSQGSWSGITIETDNNDSVFNHNIFSYGGAINQGQGYGLNVIRNSPTITNSVFENSKLYGLGLIYSTSTVSNNIFRNNLKDRLSNNGAQASGLLLDSGSPTITNNLFENNTYGMQISRSRANISNNTFNGNENEAIRTSSFFGTLSGNSGERNVINGILLSGDLAEKDGEDVTMGANPLPYVIKTYSVEIPKDSTLNIPSGVALKGEKRIEVKGALNIQGNTPSDIIFTSINDGSIGGDTLNNGALSTTSASGFYLDIKKEGTLNASGFTFRYGGEKNKGAIHIKGSCKTEDKEEESENSNSHTISNSLVTTNYPYGLLSDKAQVTISNTTFANHVRGTNRGEGVGMVVYDSHLSLSDVIFQDNDLGVQGDDDSTYVTSNIQFISNISSTSPEELLGE